MNTRSKRFAKRKDVASSSQNTERGLISVGLRHESQLIDGIFVSEDAKQWFHSKCRREIVQERKVDQSIIDDLQLQPLFDKLGWGRILTMGDYFYPELIIEFYANATINKLNEVISYVRGCEIQITKNTFMKLLDLPRDDFCHSSCINYWDLRRHHSRHLDSLPTMRRKKNLSGTDSRVTMTPNMIEDPVQWVILALLHHNILPRESKDLNATDCFMIDYVVDPDTKADLSLSGMMLNHLIHMIKKKATQHLGFPFIIQTQINKVGVDTKVEVSRPPMDPIGPHTLGRMSFTRKANGWEKILPYQSTESSSGASAHSEHSATAASIPTLPLPQSRAVSREEFEAYQRQTEAYQRQAEAYQRQVEAYQRLVEAYQRQVEAEMQRLRDQVRTGGRPPQ